MNDGDVIPRTESGLRLVKLENQDSTLGVDDAGQSPIVWNEL